MMLGAISIPISTAWLQGHCHGVGCIFFTHVSLTLWFIVFSHNGRSYNLYIVRVPAEIKLYPRHRSVLWTAYLFLFHCMCISLSACLSVRPFDYIDGNVLQTAILLCRVRPLCRFFEISKRLCGNLTAVHARTTFRERYLLNWTFMSKYLDMI